MGNREIGCYHTPRILCDKVLNVNLNCNCRNDVVQILLMWSHKDVRGTLELQWVLEGASVRGLWERYLGSDSIFRTSVSGKNGMWECPVSNV